jgi:hypothetical protein
MAITPTRLANIIVPEIWNPYVVQRTTELSNLWNSGIVGAIPELANFVSAGGNTINMPFWQDLSGQSEVLSATGVPLSVNPITAAQDQAVVLARGKAWGVNELAAAIAGGTDPMQVIGDLVANWWARDMQRTLKAMLTGIFDSATMSANIHDISAVANGQAITGVAFLDALQKLGDAKDNVAAIMMHSATETALAKINLIEFVRLSDAEPRVPFLMGKRVIIDDGATVTGSGTTAVYDTYLFGAGAIGYANGVNSRVTETEVDRDSLAGEDYLINRRHFILHPRGVRYVGVATGGGPDNTVLADGDSWTRVYDPKNIRIVLFRHRLYNAAS